MIEDLINYEHLLKHSVFFNILGVFRVGIWGNLVDGSPSARNTGFVGGPHGGLGPVPITARDPPKWRIERKS